MLLCPNPSVFLNVCRLNSLKLYHSLKKFSVIVFLLSREVSLIVSVSVSYNFFNSPWNFCFSNMSCILSSSNWFRNKINSSNYFKSSLFFNWIQHLSSLKRLCFRHTFIISVFTFFTIWVSSFIFLFRSINAKIITFLVPRFSA